MVQVLRRNFYVHRVVAFTFLGPPPTEEAWQVHHRDGSGSNNRLENLEYVTPSQNMRFLHASLTRRYSGTPQSLSVMWRAVGSQSWTTSPSMTLVALELGMSVGAVSRGCRDSKAVKGYEFRLADRPEGDVVEGEVWRQMCDPISGVEVPGRMVSSVGRIKSQTGRISWGSFAKVGYLRTKVNLNSQGCRTELVHRLVAFAFMGPPASKEQSQVNHKDFDKCDNSVDNLEYVTASENVKHRYASSTNTNGSRKMDKNGKPVESRLLKTIDGWTWHPTVSSAAKSLGVSFSSISACIKGEKTSVRGYEFRLAAADIYPGEEWRDIDLPALLCEKAKRCSV